MSWTKIGLYYALATVLGTYFFLVEWKPNKRPGLVDPTAPVVIQQSYFLPGAREDIQEVTLKRDNVSIVCRRDGERWTVVEPTGLNVSSDLVTSFVENLTPTKEVTIIDKEPKDVKAYGLDRPTTTVVVKDKAGKEIATVSLGGLNPTSSAVYARKDPSPQIYLLGQSVSYYAQLVFEKVGNEKKS
ncbi:MAG: DUF4340 domain-containing protein [Deltaproteobacteria bacterium]|nr:DUF4340 domain-containing protein [Deltaproteobacteria bacterium]